MDCKHWKVQNRNITEEEALKFVYPKDIRQIKKPHVLYDRNYICEDKANTLACVYEVDLYRDTCMYYFGHHLM